MTSTSPRRLVALDALRGIAILVVVFMHIPHSYQALQSIWAPVSIALDYGYLGVHLFLVLSGFCIHLRVAPTMGNRQVGTVDMVQFWKRRFWRLYPPYVVAAVFSLVLYYVATDTVVLDNKVIIRSLPWDIVTHVLMVHNLFMDYMGGLGNGAFWTLALEEQLYFLYAGYLWLRRRSSPAATFQLIFWITICWRVLYSILTTPDTRFGYATFEIGDFGRWPFAYWWCWILGACAAEAYCGTLQLPAACYQYRTAAAAFILGAATNSILLGRLTGSRYLATATGWDGWSMICAPVMGISDLLSTFGFFVLVCRWTRAETITGGLGRVRARLLAPIGVVSYSLYLTHVPVFQAAETVFYGAGWGNTPSENILRYIILFPLSLAVAYVFYQLVERRFLNRPAGATLRASGRAGNPLKNHPAIPIEAPAPR